MAQPKTKSTATTKPKPVTPDVTTLGDRILNTMKDGSTWGFSSVSRATWIARPPVRYAMQDLFENGFLTRVTKGIYKINAKGRARLLARTGRK